MRKKIIAGNWKMNKTIAEAVSFARDLKVRTFDINKTEIIICPPFTALNATREIIKGSRIRIGAQNVHWESSGAFTGEVSAEMLESAGCEYVIIGHSERRQYFGETNQTINQKIKHTLTTGLTSIVCFGETLQQRQEGLTKQVVKIQLEEGLEGFTAANMQRIVLAYEPVWAIGTGVTATPEQAEEVHEFIRELIREMFIPQTSESLHILYGGSANPENIKTLLSQNNIDGGLIGGASLKLESFTEMIKIAEEILN